MVNNTPETNAGAHNDKDLAKIRDDINKEIAEAKRTHNEAQLRDKLLRDLKQKQFDAAEVAVEIRDNAGKFSDKNKEKAKEVRKSVVRVLEAVKQGIIEPPEHTKAVFIALADKGVNEAGSASLQAIVDKYLEKDIVVSAAGSSAIVEDFETLKNTNSKAAKLLAEALQEAARAGNLGDVTEDQAREIFSTHEIEPIKPRDAMEKMVLELMDGGRGMTGEEASEFARDWQQYLNNFFNRDDDYMETLQAIYSPKKFEQLARKKFDHIAESHHFDKVRDKKTIDIHVSEEIERDIVLTFSKLFSLVDSAPPTEFFSEIITEGFMQSIQSAYQSLDRKLDLLTNSAARGINSEYLKNFTFTQKYSQEAIEAKHQKISDTESKRVPQPRVYPLIQTRTEGVAMKDFLASVRLEVRHERETRAYLHNVRAMFYKGPGKDGFWPQLAHYAEEMKSTDIDGIMNLPDSNIFMSAYRLYQKYVEEEFAKLDWRHAPHMFSKDMGNIYNKMEQEVYSTLLERFPELKEGKDEWRAKRAMTMAVGLARGILLTEVETAAWADPHLSSENGKPTFLSYYTNDNTALNGLNPQHALLRFFSQQGSKGPLLFLPAANFKPNPFGIWDHRDLWKNLQKFQKSFVSGGSTLHEGKPAERTLMELLPNIMNVGSVVTRHGWRTGPAYEGWFTYKTKIENGERLNTTNIEVLKTWKALENIGYEVLWDFVGGKVPDALLLGTGAYKKEERDEFFKYLYKKYINPQAADDAAVTRGLESYLEKVKPEVTKSIDELIKQGKIFPKERKDAIEKEQYRRVMYRSLVGVLKDRIPTKFIRVERDRLSKGGRRAWDRLAVKLGLSIDDMDEAMRNLALVETMVRQNTSDAMKKHLEDKSNEGDLSTFTGTYQLTEQAIRAVFNKGGEKEERKLNLALKLFKGIQDNYFNNETYMDEFALKIRNRDAAGFIIDKTFPFALATEELDLSFLAYRASGERMLARATGDIGAAESEVFKGISDIINQLQPLSVAPGEKRSFMPLVESIAKVKAGIQGRISQDYANKVASHLASMVIAYYKKDTGGRGLSRFFTIGEVHSLAGEFAGGFKDVWEWDVATIDKFIFELARTGTVESQPYDLVENPVEEKPRYSFNLFGKKVEIGKIKTKRKPNFEFSEKKLRGDFGVDKKHIAFEMLQTVIPLVALYILWKMFTEAMKELEMGGQKK